MKYVGLIFARRKARVIRAKLVGNSASVDRSISPKTKYSSRPNEGRRVARLDPKRAEAPAGSRQETSLVRSLPVRVSTLLYFVIGILTLQAGLAGAETHREIKIGVRAYLGAQNAIARWQETANFLTKNINGYSFEIIPFGSPEAIVSAAKRNEVDYAITDPSSFVRMEVRTGAKSIASLINVWQGKPVDRFGAVIFALNTNPDILTLKDLRGKTLMAVDPAGFGGWQMVKEEFHENDLAPEELLAELTFAYGNQLDVVSAVLEGRVDAGVVRTGVLERLNARGEIDINRVHAVMPHAVAGFPFLLSSDLYPEWAFVELSSAPRGLSDAITSALLKISPTSNAAKNGEYFGWQEPLSYRSVHRLLQRLGAPPYEFFGESALWLVFWKYRYWILVLALSVVALIAVLVFAMDRQIRLSKSRKQLLDNKTRELGFMQDALNEHAIVSVADAKGKITYANRKFSEISGYSVQELLGEDHRILKSGTHSPEFYSDLMRTLFAGNPWKGRIRNRRKDGTYYWVQSTIVPQLDENGAPIKFISIRTDITESLGDQARLNLRDFFDLIADEIYIFDPNTLKITFLNQKAQSKMGLEKNEALTKTAMDIVPEGDEENFRKNLQSLIEGRKPKLFYQIDTVLPDGQTVSSEVNIQYLKADGLAPKFLAAITDISDRKAAQDEALLLRRTLNNIEHRIFMFWPETYDLVYLNSAAQKHAGLSLEEWKEKTVFDCIDDSHRAKLEEMCQALIRGPEKIGVFETVDRRGSPIEISVHLVQPRGKQPWFLSIFRDISVRKKADKAKTEFISTVSHELRTPLTAIKGALGLLKTGSIAKDPEKLGKLLDIAYLNVDRLSVLVNDLLDWEKIEAGKMTYNMKEVDLSELIHAAVEVNQSYAGSCGVTIDVSDCDERLRCKGDKTRLMQVITNLISNAAKFSPEGATVEIRLERIGETARISVIDSGCGIPKEAQPIIFDKFTQADSSDQRKIGGTGLGLSIVKMIVEGHGGSVNFISEEGKGTTFFVDLALIESENS